MIFCFFYDLIFQAQIKHTKRKIKHTNIIVKKYKRVQKYKVWHSYFYPYNVSSNRHAGDKRTAACL